MKQIRNFFLSFLLLFLLNSCASLQDTSVLIPEAKEILWVHFLDVGQADAALLVFGDHAMLIDGGNVADSDLIVAYLQEQNIQSLDYVVCSHGHEDHVGGLSAALANFPVAEVLSPITDYDSQAFQNFLKYTQQQDLTINVPSPQDQFYLGEEVKITVLGPVQEYENANDMSLVLKIEYENTSFLFTGDMERAAEEDILASSADLSATVLKVCHHGSDTSSTYPFLYEVNPRYGVISCEFEGKYGHPSEEVLSRFKDAEIDLYRTDLQGHIVAQSDGNRVTFSTERNEDVDTNPKIVLTSGAYIGNVNSKAFHLESCSGLPAEENRCYFASREDAVAEGFTPCGRCKP